MTDSPRKKKKEKKEKKSARGEKKGEREKGEREKGDEELLLDLNFDSSKTTKAFIDLKDCPVQNVTVYNDRAEVTRHVEASVQAGSVSINYIHQLCRTLSFTILIQPAFSAFL